MTSAGLQYRRLRAPQQDRQVLVEPPLASAGDALRQNLELRQQRDCDVQGRSLQQLAAAARQHLFEAAHRYTLRYRDVHFAEHDADTPLILTGHQPQLYHCGVWFKNFVLSHVAERRQAVAVNLLIDNDTAGAASLRVPGGSVDEPRLETVPLDRPSARVAYEHRSIHDPSLFRSFADRVGDVVRPLVPDPLVHQLWPHAIEAQQHTANLGRCVSQARHVLEGQWGLNSYEVPLSTVCEGEAFCWFAAHLLAQLPRLQPIYNQSLAEYRSVNHVRSAAHPAPDLAEQDDWREAPFWVWTDEDARRRAVWVQHHADRLLLSDRAQWQATLELTAEGSAQRSVEQLLELPRHGVRLRPRALTTTLFARLLLGDLFLHGIGGAKYDQVTDLLIQRFFETPAPEFVVATATLRLPVARPHASQDDLRRVQRQLRELRFHPEHHVDGRRRGDEQVAQLIDQKREWIRRELPRGARRERHAKIEEANQRLQPFVDEQRQDLQQERDQLVELLRRAKVLDSREHSFCLFPAESLKDFLLEITDELP